MTVVVGSAEILIKANTKAFAAEVETQTRPAFTEMEREAALAGEKSGTAMAAGMRSGSATMTAEAKAAGAAAGTGMSQHVEQGAKRSETAMVAAAGTGRKAFLGATAAIIGTAAEGVHLAEGMQSTEATIAGAAGTSVKAAKAVGDALLGTAGKSEFSGSVQAKAYAAVAGQLRAVEGHALSAGDAEKFMHAAGDLAVAKQIDLGVAVGVTASIMQAFQLKTKDAAHVTDVLFQASNATGVGVDTLGNQLTKLRSKLGDTGGSLTDVAGLLVDMTEHGVTGRAALSGVTSGLTTLQKTAGAVTNAQREQDQAFAQMPPTLQRLARSFQNGEISQAQFNKATKVLTPEQKALVTTFNAANTTLDHAQAKYKGLGIEVFDAHGKFVGMDRIIGQLAPKFAHMSQQQQIATATTLFGAGAAKQMVAVINAGPAAYEKATSAVGKHNAAQSAASKQSKTLHGELHTLGAEVSDVATEFGQVLVPAATSVIHVIASATHYVLDHKAAAIALAAVITGTLGVAIGVFTVNKMAKMVTSVKAAGGELRAFAGVAANVARRVAASFGVQSGAAEESAAKVRSAQAGEAASVRTTATTVQAENAASGRSFTMVGTSTVKSAATVEAGVAAEATAVTAADTTIEAENVAAAASFTAMLGPIAAVAAAAAIAYGPVKKLLGPGITDTTQTPNEHGYGTYLGTPAQQVAHANQVGHSLLTGKHSPFNWNNFLGSLPGGTTAAHHAAATATAGLTAKQRKQLAAIQSGIGGGGSSTGGGATHTKAATSYTPTTFAEAILRGIGAPVTHANVAGLVGWENAEGGHWHNHAKFNPLNTTLPMPGAGNTGSQGNIKVYTSWAQGLAATIKTLHGYGAITDILKAGHGGQRLAGAIGSSPWGTSGTLVSSTIAHAVVGHLAGAVTKTVQSDPTKWARAMIGHFAESTGKNTGPELDKLQAEFHTRAAAWCAEFATTAAVMGGAHKSVRSASVDQVAQWAAVGSHGFEKGIKRAGRAGDLVLLHGASGYHGHIGMVESINRARGTFTSIEGNTSAGKVARVTHRLSDSEGFARPVYPAGSVAGGGGAPALTKDQKQLLATEKLVAGQQNAFNKWLAGQRAVESQMTGAQRKALNEEVAIKRSALGIQTTREFAALTTQTHQQKTHLTHMAGDQKLASAMMTRLVAAAHSGSLRALNTTLALAHKAGFDSLVKRLSHDHISGFAALAKQLVKVHKDALDKQTMAAIDAGVKAAEKKAAAEAAAKAATDSTAAAVIGYTSQLATDTANAQVQALQDQTKVTIDQGNEAGKTGADLVAAQAQTHLDIVTGQQNQLIGAAQVAVDKAAGGTETQKAQAAADLAAAQASAALSEAQAQAALDLDTAAASAADAAASASDAASAASDSTPVGEPGLPPSPTFNFVINGAGMSAAELFAEVGWGLKTGTLPVAAA